MNNPQCTTAKAIGSANLAQTGQALIIQNYANSVNEQPPVDFSGEAKLAVYQKQINAGLTAAQGHASTYLNTIQPAIIQNIANIGNYYAINNAVLTTLPAGSTDQQWMEALTALQVQSAQYQTAAAGVVTSLKTLVSELSADTTSFATTVSELNAAVNGDQGVLTSINGQLSTVQGQIDGAIAGTVLSGLTIVGGIFLIACGSVAEFATAGTSTSLVLAGVGIAATGVGGEVASAIALKNLNDEKANLLTEEANLTAEVKLATGISNGYQSLANQVTAAVTAATQMSNAWSSLSADLGAMISDLRSGVTNAGTLRTIFLTAANTEIQTVITDITTIKGQLAGVTNIVAAPGQTVGEALVAAAQAHAV